MTRCHSFWPILTNYDMRHLAGFVVADHIQPRPVVDLFERNCNEICSFSTSYQNMECLRSMSEKCHSPVAPQPVDMEMAWIGLLATSCRNMKGVFPTVRPYPT